MQAPSNSKTAVGDVLPIYESGVSFNEALLDEAALLAFVKGKLFMFVQLGTNPGDEHRMVGRFATEREEPIEVRVSKEFRVRRLSLNGMLVESAAATELKTVMQVQLQLGRAKFISRGRVANVESLEVVDGWQLYGIGIEFVDTKRTQRRKLDRFVRRVVSQRQE